MDLQKLKYTAFVNLYGWFRIPLIAFVSPRIREFDEKKCILEIPLGYRTKNHLGAMYFGALAIGAELSIAVAAVLAIQESGERIDFVFKDFDAKFLKRAEGDVHFVSLEVDEVKKMIRDSVGVADRIERKFKGFAYVPGKEKTPIESAIPVMTYELTLSVRNRGPARGG